MHLMLLSMGIQILHSRKSFCFYLFNLDLFQFESIMYLHFLDLVLGMCLVDLCLDMQNICFRLSISCSVCFHYRYVPTHLHLMVFELVKNSLRAVQERFMESDKVAPPVRIIVADGLEDVTIKVLFVLLCISMKSLVVTKLLTWFILTEVMVTKLF